MKTFEGRVLDFLNILRTISYPLSKEYRDANSMKYDLLIYVKDWKEEQKWMYLTSNNSVEVIKAWMKNQGYKQYTKKHTISKYMILESKTSMIIYDNKLIK